MRYHDEVVAHEDASQSEIEEALRQRVAALESALSLSNAALTTTSETLTKTSETLSRTTAELEAVTVERDKLRRAYELLKAQVELLRRRIFLAKAERIDTQLELELEFADPNLTVSRLTDEFRFNETTAVCSFADGFPATFSAAAEFAAFAVRTVDTAQVSRMTLGSAVKVKARAS